MQDDLARTSHYQYTIAASRPQSPHHEQQQQPSPHYRIAAFEQPRNHHAFARDDTPVLLSPSPFIQPEHHHYHSHHYQREYEPTLSIKQPTPYPVAAQPHPPQERYWGPSAPPSRLVEEQSYPPQHLYAPPDSQLAFQQEQQQNRFALMTASVSSWCSYYRAILLPVHGRGKAQSILMCEITRIMVSTIACLILFAGVAALGIGKAYIDGFSTYMSYFTNWAWTLYGIFYGLMVLGHLAWAPLMRISLYALTMAVNGVSLSVLIIVSIILYNNPDLLLHMIKGMGGDAPAGLVIVMNCVFHPIAVILFLIFAVLHYKEITWVFYDAKKAMVIWLKRWNPRNRALDDVSVLSMRMTSAEFAISIFVDICFIYSPILVLLIYLACYDPTVVYGYQVLNAEVIIGVLAVCTFCNGIPYLIMSYCPIAYDPVSCELCGVGHPLQGVEVMFMTFPQILSRMKSDEELALSLGPPPQSHDPFAPRSISYPAIAENGQVEFVIAPPALSEATPLSPPLPPPPQQQQQQYLVDTRRVPMIRAPLLPLFQVSSSHRHAHNS